MRAVSKSFSGLSFTFDQTSGSYSTICHSKPYAVPPGISVNHSIQGRPGDPPVFQFMRTSSFVGCQFLGCGQSLVLCLDECSLLIHICHLPKAS